MALIDGALRLSETVPIANTGGRWNGPNGEMGRADGRLALPYPSTDGTTHIIRDAQGVQ